MFQAIQHSVNNSDSIEEEVIDEENWNHTLGGEINATFSDDIDTESEIGFHYQICCQRNLIQDTTDPQIMNKIIVGYNFPRHTET